MKKIFFNYQILLFIFTFGIFSVMQVRAQNNKFVNIKSCRNYPHKKGINFKIKQPQSFEILSTSNIEVIGDLASFALDEAQATAYTNLSDFLKLSSSSNNEDDLFKDLNIRKNGRFIRGKSQIKNDLKFLNSFFSNGYRGIRIIDACYKSGKYVMVTIKVTDKTYKMAEFLEKRMK